MPTNETKFKEYKTRDASYVLDDSGKSTREYTRTWMYVADAHTENAASVIAAFTAETKIEAKSEYPSDKAALCRSIKASADSDDSLNWVITVTYKKLANATDDSEDSEDSPLDDKAEISWDFQQYEENVEFDQAGKAIKNSAGDPFQNPIVRDRSRAVLTVVQNEAQYSVNTALTYGDTINNNTFMSCPRYTLLCKPPKAKKIFSTAVKIGYYWQVTYEFHLNPQGWLKRVLDAGLYEKRQDPSAQNQLKLVPILDDHGMPVTVAKPLNGYGQKLHPEGNPNWLEFKVYPMTNFNFNFRS